MEKEIFNRDVKKQSIYLLTAFISDTCVTKLDTFIITYEPFAVGSWDILNLNIYILHILGIWYTILFAIYHLQSIAIITWKRK